MNKSTKPFFTEDQLNKLVANFKTTMDRNERPYDDALIEGLKKYAQSPKTDYENAILRGCIDGTYDICCKDGQATFAVHRPAIMDEIQVSGYDELKKLSENPEAVRKMQLDSVEKDIPGIVKRMHDAEKNLANAIHIIARFGKRDAGSIEKFVTPAPAVAE